MSSSRKFLLWAISIGLLAYPIGFIAPAAVHLALILPLVLSIKAFCFLRNLPMQKQVTWCLAASLCSTVAFTMVMAGVGLSFGSMQFALGMVPAPFWFPWLFLFAVTPLWVRSVLATFPVGWRWVILVLSVVAIYLLSAGICFDLRDRTPPTDVEQRDTLGREPAIGPGVWPTVRLICRPRGPSFLFSTDYDGSEWVWTIYRPLVHGWFAWPRCKYYYPYEAAKV